MCFHNCNWGRLEDIFLFLAQLDRVFAASMYSQGTNSNGYHHDHKNIC